MSLAELLPLIAGGGIGGTILLVGYLFHRDAVRSHDKRADDWKSAARDWKDIARERGRQMDLVLQTVEEIKVLLLERAS